MSGDLILVLACQYQLVDITFGNYELDILENRILSKKRFYQLLL